MITLCKNCHKDLHNNKLKLNIKGENGFKDRMAQRTMQGKTYMYKELSKDYNLSLVYGYQTSEFRKSLNLPKDHDVDALCISTLQTGEIIPYNRDNFYNINFRAVQTRRQYHDLPRKVKGRIKYQVNKELQGFRKGDLVLVKGKWLKQINSIRSTNYLKFKKILNEPGEVNPKFCRLIENNISIILI